MASSWQINSFEDTNQLAKNIQKKMRLPQFIGLIGPMGVGKTYFVKALAGALGCQNSDLISSPSFALHQRYESLGFTIEHLDLFRLESEEDLESIGFWDLFAEENILIVVEWADRLEKKFIPKKFNPIYLKFEMINQQRTVSIF